MNRERIESGGWVVSPSVIAVANEPDLARPRLADCDALETEAMGWDIDDCTDCEQPDSARLGTFT